MTQVIGFTEVFYTLWEVGEPYEVPVYYKAMKVGATIKQDVVYIQNLSKELDKAKAKMKGDYKIDLELRGHSSFTRTLSSNIKDRENYYGSDCFSFGRMEGCMFAECTDVWQLDRAMREEKSLRRRVYARLRLAELGELIRYDWKETLNKVVMEPDGNGGMIEKRTPEGDFEFEFDRMVRHRYAWPKQVEKFEREKYLASFTAGHHFTDGSKVTLEIKEIDAFSFEGRFGTTYVRTYATKCGKQVKYMGSSPAEISNENFVEVAATIKHDNYKGAETKLLRIKLLTKV